MQTAFRSELGKYPNSDWPNIDVTEIYKTARKEAFAKCRRVLVYALPGEAYVLHRFALHGVSPWQPGAVAPPEGRAILYFRPEIDRQAWLDWDADHIA